MLLKSQGNVAILYYYIFIDVKIIFILWYISNMQISDSITDQEIFHFSTFKMCMYFIHIFSKDRELS